MALVDPGRENLAEHARLLLGLARDPGDVQTTSDGSNGIAFVVPDYLEKLYLKALKVKEGVEIDANEADEDEQSNDDQVKAPVKRKPGRPPKNTDS